MRRLLRRAREIGRRLQRSPDAAGRVDEASTVGLPKFEHRFPSDQNAVDLLRGHWNADLSFAAPGLKAGTSPLFTDDPRPAQAAAALGTNGRLDGYRILELGPLEGAHSYQMERLGAASVLAIEANVEAFLKCLIVRQLCDLQNVRFLLGDFTAYLAAAPERFDLVFCSGVLYHMTDPVELIRAIANITDRCFVWTHYYDASHYAGMPRTAVPSNAGPRYFQLAYPDMASGTFLGGNKSVSSWMARDDVIEAFRTAGFDDVTIIEENPNHPNGACFSFAARRSSA